jgi:hypothetical protein
MKALIAILLFISLGAKGQQQLFWSLNQSYMDPDALAYITRLKERGYTPTAGEEAALSTYAASIKGNNLRPYCISDWPMLGTTAATQALDFWGAHDLTFFGTYTRDAFGLMPASGAYAATGINPSTISGFALNNQLSFYTRTSGQSAETNFNMGVATNVETGADLSALLLRRISTNEVAFDAWTGTTNGRVTSTTTTGSGMWVGGVANASTRVLYRNGTIVASRFVTVGQTMPNGQYYLFACNDVNTGTAKYFGSQQCSFASIHFLMPSAVATYSTIVNTLMANLSTPRNTY